MLEDLTVNKEDNLGFDQECWMIAERWSARAEPEFVNWCDLDDATAKLMINPHNDALYLDFTIIKLKFLQMDWKRIWLGNGRIKL